MKCTCKQCGKEFELSASEIDFYKKKNLNLPKRCKECRQANKKGQERQIQYTNSSGTQNGMHNQHNVAAKQRDNRLHKWTYGLTAGILFVIVGCIGLLLRSFVLWNSSTEGETVYSTESLQSEAIDFVDTAPDEIIDAKEPPQSETVDLPESVPDEDNGGTEQPQNEDIDETEQLQNENANEMELGQSEVPDSAESVQSEDSGTRQYVFRSTSLLNDHFQKHGVEMGFSSAEEYQAAASAVVNNANALHKLEKEDGDDVYYLESTNEFVIVATDGYIRTYFYPDSGIEYYNKQ